MKDLPKEPAFKQDLKWQFLNTKKYNPADAKAHYPPFSLEKGKCSWLQSPHAVNLPNGTLFLWTQQDKKGFFKWIQPSTGRVLWEVACDGKVTGLILMRGHQVVFGVDNVIYLLDIETQEIQTLPALRESENFRDLLRVSAHEFIFIVDDLIKKFNIGTSVCETVASGSNLMLLTLLPHGDLLYRRGSLEQNSLSHHIVNLVNSTRTDLKAENIFNCASAFEDKFVAVANVEGNPCLLVYSKNPQSRVYELKETSNVFGDQVKQMFVLDDATIVVRMSGALNDVFYFHKSTSLDVISILELNDSITSSCILKYIAHQHFYLQMLKNKTHLLNSKDYYGNTALHRASRAGELSWVKHLVEKLKADVQLPGSLDELPLHCAAEEGHVEVVRYLVETQENIDLSAPDSYGYTPLHLAARGGHLSLVKILVENGANAFVGEKRGDMLPIHEAAYQGRIDVVQYFLEIKQDVDIPAKNNNNKGRTPLYFALEGQNPEIVRLLVDKFHANYHRVDDVGNSALHLAARYGLTGVVTYLVKDLKMNVNLVGYSGMTPLHAAAINGELSTVLYLLKENALPQKEDKLGILPVNRAFVQSGDPTARGIDFTETILALYQPCLFSNEIAIKHRRFLRCVLVNDPNPRQKLADIKTASIKLSSVELLPDLAQEAKLMQIVPQLVVAKGLLNDFYFNVDAIRENIAIFLNWSIAAFSSVQAVKKSEEKPKPKEESKKEKKSENFVRKMQEKLPETLFIHVFSFLAPKFFPIKHCFKIVSISLISINRTVEKCATIKALKAIGKCHPDSKPTVVGEFGFWEIFNSEFAGSPLSHQKKMLRQEVKIEPNDPKIGSLLEIMGIK